MVIFLKIFKYIYIYIKEMVIGAYLIGFGTKLCNGFTIFFFLIQF